MFKKLTAIFAILFYYSIAPAQWVQIGNDIRDTSYAFGDAIALNDNGNIIAAAARDGAVSVYQNRNNTWEQVGPTIVKHKFDNLGESNLVINGLGNIIAYNTPVQILKFDGLKWTQMGSTIDTSSLGFSMSINDTGNVLVASKLSQGYSMINENKIFVYHYHNENWELYGENKSSFDTLRVDGRSVSLNADGTILAASNGIIVQVFKLEDNKWIPFGDMIRSSHPGFIFGEEVLLSNDGLTLAVAAYGWPAWGGGHNTFASVYEYTDGAWRQKGGDIEYEWNEYVRISINGKGDIVSCCYDYYEGGRDSYVKVFGYNGTYWEQRGQSIIGEGGKGPKTVNLNNEGNILAIGEPNYVDTITNITGRVRIFKLCDTYSHIYITEPYIYYMPDGTEITYSGVYNDTIPNSAGCDSIISYNVTIENEPISLLSIDTTSIKLYPNPTKGIVYFEGYNLQSIDNIQVISVYGSEVDHEVTGNTINLGTNSKGIYFIRFRFNDKIVMKKIILE